MVPGGYVRARHFPSRRYVLFHAWRGYSHPGGMCFSMRVRVVFHQGGCVLFHALARLFSILGQRLVLPHRFHPSTLQEFFIKELLCLVRAGVASQAWQLLARWPWTRTQCGSITHTHTRTPQCLHTTAPHFVRHYRRLSPSGMHVRRLRTWMHFAYCMRRRSRLCRRWVWFSLLDVRGQTDALVMGDSFEVE